MAQNTGMHMADKEFKLCVQTGFTKLFFFFFKKDVYGESSRWGGREAPYEADREDRRKHML